MSPSLKNLLLSVLAGGSVLAVIAVAVIAGAPQRLTPHAPGAFPRTRTAAPPPGCRGPAPPAALTPRLPRPAVSSFDRVVRK